ncbi:hypothetical protein KM043_016421 [Ampulex compressa]|nr:hypothetical protein KM043_016421 [Ampulex compressa]
MERGASNGSSRSSGEEGRGHLPVERGRRGKKERTRIPTAERGRRSWPVINGEARSAREKKGCPYLRWWREEREKKSGKAGHAPASLRSRLDPASATRRP